MEFCEGGALQTRCWIEIETLDLAACFRNAPNNLSGYPESPNEVKIARALDKLQTLPQPAKKEIPRITFKNLSPPFTDYDYFQGHQKYPFQVKATSFSLINAWWLAEASTLVYANEDFVRARFSQTGLPQVTL